MKKALIVGLIAAAMASANVQAWTPRDTYEAMTPDENLEPITFRCLEWSDNLDTALRKLIEADELTEKDYNFNEDKTFITIYSYKIISDQDVMTFLSFYDDGGPLRMATYSFYGEHSTPQQYYLDFAELYDALVSIYGEPTLNADQWITDTYVGDEAHYGEGICSGCMGFYRGWMARDGSAISLHIDGDNGKITSFNISYFSPGLVFPPIDSGL